MPIPGGYRVYCEGECVMWCEVGEVEEITSNFMCRVDALYRAVYVL